MNNHYAELRPHVNPSETLLWTGQPQTGIIFRNSDLFMIPFSLVWCGFSIFWVVMAAQASLLFSLFGLPFVAIGLMMVFGRFFIDAKLRKNTVYGITQNSIIIRSGIFSKSTKSINIKTISDIEYTEKNDGSGTIVLGPKPQMNNNRNGTNLWPGMNSVPQLDLIPNVRKVYQQIIDLQRNS